MIKCGVMACGCGQAFALDSTFVTLQQDTAHLHIARTCRDLVGQEGHALLTGCSIHQTCHLSNTFGMFWIGVQVKVHRIRVALLEEWDNIPRAMVENRGMSIRHQFLNLQEVCDLGPSTPLCYSCH